MLKGPNQGRLIQLINGIAGVAAGGNAVVNMPVNQRYHRNIFQCAAVNYTGGTALTTTKVTGAGNNNLTLTPTVTLGVPLTAAVAAGGTGYTTGDVVSLNDVTGTGATFTVTAIGGVVSAVAYNAGTATPSPINPATLIPALKESVNGINMRDITPLQRMMIAQANGSNQRLGEMPLFYTEPWRNLLRPNEANSWDLTGQATFQIQFAIAGGYTNPQVTGSMEFDYQRNATKDAQGNAVPYLEPVSQHAFQFALAAGVTSINTVPFDFPISRLWFLGSVPGNITQIEIYQDSNKVFEGTLAQMQEMYGEYGFQFGQSNYVNQNQTTAKPLGLNPVTYFDAAYISDPDQRYWKALKCSKSLVIRVYSATAQTLTIISETLPGAYSA